MEEILYRWYGANPRVRRLWVHETERDVKVLVALSPVGDSDDTSPIWLAMGAAWQVQLRTLLGRPVRLEYVDDDLATPLSCVMHIAWRDPLGSPPAARAFRRQNPQCCDEWVSSRLRGDHEERAS